MPMFRVSVIRRTDSSESTSETGVFWSIVELVGAVWSCDVVTPSTRSSADVE